MKQVKVIKAKDEDELAKKMNLEYDSFAAQPIQKKDGTWICFIYIESSKKPQGKFDPKALATDKQKEYMRGLGIDFKENITKLEASKLIEENKDKTL